MRLRTYEDYVDRVVRERWSEEMCYAHILRSEDAQIELVENLKTEFPQFVHMTLEFRRQGEFISVVDPDTKLVHFSYHPSLQRPVVITYVKTKRSTVRKEWVFWNSVTTPNKNDPGTILPSDVLAYVLSYCNCRDLLRVRTLSRAWRKAADNEGHWMLRFACLEVYDQIPSQISFFKYFLGFETDEQLLIIGRAWWHADGRSPGVRLFVGGKGMIYPLGEVCPKRVLRWVGTGYSGTGVVAWINYNDQLRLRSSKSMSGVHTKSEKLWLFNHVLRYCDDVYQGKILNL